jgi:hypothetical protein
MSKFYRIPVSGSGTSLARWTFQSLINISFPKIVGEREGEKHFWAYNLSITYSNLYNFSAIFFVNLSKIFLQWSLFKKLCKMFCWITYFLLDECVVKIAKIAWQNCNITTLVGGMCHTPKELCPCPPGSFLPKREDPGYRVYRTHRWKACTVH